MFSSRRCRSASGVPEFRGWTLWTPGTLCSQLWHVVHGKLSPHAPKSCPTLDNSLTHAMMVGVTCGSYLQISVDVLKNKFGY